MHNIVSKNKNVSMKEIDNIIKNELSKAYPGAVLLVAKKNEIIHFNAYGYAVLIPQKIKMEKNTIFDLASLTKPIVTSTLIMKLYEKGKINLYDKVNEYIPKINNKITILNLLTHTSGLTPWIPLYKICKDNSRDSIIEIIANWRRENKPGEKVIYSDLNYILLGFIIEELYNDSLDKVANKEIFQPLNMKNTMFNPPSYLRKRIAATEFCPWRKRIIWGEVHDENAYFLGGVAGHAGLFSTAHDLLIFSLMMLNYGVFRGTRILSRESIEIMTEEHTKGLNERRGIGWLLKQDKWPGGSLLSNRAYGHTGFTGTSLFIDPEYELIIILLTNRIHPTRNNTRLIKIRPQIHEKIVEILMKKKLI